MSKEIVNNLLKVKQDLQAQIKALTDDLQSVNRMLGRYEGQMSLEPQTDIDETPKTLRHYVLEVLRENYPKSLRAKKVREQVLSKGYKSSAVSFEGAMFAMLSHLVKLERIKKTGVGLYRALRPVNR